MPLEQGFHLDTFFAQAVFNSEDAKEGPKAFAEKRRPVFKGR